MSLTDDILMHYGMPRRSGRYPWGSGDNPYQHSGDFLSRVEEMKKSGFTFTDKDGKTYTGEVAIAKSMGLSTTQFRTQMSLAKDERRSADVSAAKALREKGYSLNEIAEKMGFANDSSVRSLLNESSEARMNQAKTTAEFLKKQVDEKGMIDIGTGVERELGISKEKMNQALYILQMEGYPVYGGGVPQVTNPGKQTNIKVLCPPGTEHKEIYNFENVHSVRDYVSHDGGDSLINKRAEEGDWGEWADKLPSQFLSKQSLTLVNKQLNLAASDKMAEFDEICSLTNPTVKKSLLRSFADDCDSAAVHLQAAALPRQKYQVILPITSMKDNEVYAPNYKNGETVALIRYPHGGTFEIPILTVNNKQAEARRVLGNTPKDAIGINSKVAERLSGADFDGDTVMVIPCNSRNSKIKITSTPPLKGLEGFDPKLEYGGKPEGTFKQMRNTQKEMGVISNLITDMTLKGATQDELARAVRHSMVVIDAEKHKLDYKQSEIDNGISSLKKKYQGAVDEDGKYHEGASTLISRAKSEVSVVKRQGSPRIDEETGELVWKTVDDPIYTDKRTGKTKVRTQPSTKMAEAKDAYTLVSEADTPIERAYANYANKMKALGNQARLEILATGKVPYSSTAKETYQAEVDSLNAKLNVALKNAPRERQAQIMANAVVAAKKQDNPDMTKAEIKKASQQALTQARAIVGAKRETIQITDREWEAIQAGAISESKLTQIINNVDMDSLRQRATPRATTTLSTAKQNKIASMNASGYSTSEIAEALGISSTTVSKYLN